MFSQVENNRAFSVPLFVLQLFLVPLLCLISGVITTVLLRAITGGNVDVIGYVSFAAVGFSLGYGAQNAFPHASLSGGRWVWIAPVCVFVAGLLFDLAKLPNEIPDFFVSRPGREGITQVLLTLPAIGSCFYSLGLLLAGRRKGMLTTDLRA